MGKIVDKVLGIVALLLLAFVVAAPWMLYAHGLSALPEDRAPSKDAIPSAAMRMLWLTMNKSSEMRMEPMSPWTLAMLPVFGSEALPAGHQVAGQAARYLLHRGPNRNIRTVEWHIARAAGAIWISRNWTAEDAGRTVLAESFLGHGFFGFRQAAQGYFGRSVQELSPSEIALLVAIGRAPSAYSPWCQPERGAARARSLLAEFQSSEVYAPRLLPSPPDACKE